MSTINLSEADTKFKYELTRQPGGENIMSCFTCLTCVSSCPITQVNNKFSPARIIRMAIFGLKEEVLKSGFIWLCSSCYTCQERCPRGVSITEFMTLLKNIAAKSGYAPKGVRAQLDIIKGQGRIYPIDDFDNKKRKKSKLPELPTSCEAVKGLFPTE